MNEHHGASGAKFSHCSLTAPSSWACVCSLALAWGIIHFSEGIPCWGESEHHAEAGKNIALEEGEAEAVKKKKILKTYLWQHVFYLYFSFQCGHLDVLLIIAFNCEE